MPPPLPGKIETNSDTFAHKAALGSLILPIAAIAFNLSAQSWLKQPETTPLMKLGFGAVAVVLMVAGLILALVAIGGMFRFGPRGILLKSSAGLILNGCLLVFFSYGLMQGYQRGLASRKALRDLEKSVKEVRQNLKDSFDPENGITDVDTDQITRVQEQLRGASKNVSAREAAMMEAMSAELGRMKTAADQYQVALNTLLAASVLNMENVTDKKAFAERRQVVQAFLAANAAFKQVLQNTEKDLRMELETRKVQEKDIQSTLNGYRTSANRDLPTTIKIRECDEVLGNSTLAALDLLEKNWGKWQFDRKSQQILFNSNEVINQYNGLMKKIQKAGQDQIALQKEMVNRY